MTSTPELDTGGPAFPCEGGESSGLHAAYGMSLRDWFAGQALAGLCADPVSGGIPMAFAKTAYAMADAMIAMRRSHLQDPAAPESAEASHG